MYPAVPGGLEVLLDLVREFESKGPTYRQARQRSFKASYTNHYRAGLIQILEALEFRSNNMVHRPVLEALELIKRYKAEHSPATLYYARGEHVPVDGVIPRDLADLLYKTDKRGRRRVQRTVYECGVFQTLRDKLRCKEIWVAGADKWRNPDEDLPADFEERRAENYAKLRKPLDPKAFTARMRAEMDRSPGRPQRPRCRSWTGWTSGNGRRPGRSSSPTWTPCPSRATCGGSRRRSGTGGAPCRCSTC